MAKLSIGIAGLLILGLVAWPSGPTGRAVPVDEVRIVQHVLIGFRGAVGFGRELPPRARQRDEGAALRLAERVLTDALNAKPLSPLAERYSDDWSGLGSGPAQPAQTACADGCGPTGEAPGVYRVTPWPPGRLAVTPAEKLHRALAKAAFELGPGEVRLFRYDGQDFPFGHEVIQRLR